MTEDAKRAARLEKKLKVLLGGYQVIQTVYLYRSLVQGKLNFHCLVYCFVLIQSRSLALNKQISDLHDQLDQCRIESVTFDMLRKQEKHAIPRRMAVRLLFSLPQLCVKKNLTRRLLQAWLRVVTFLLHIYHSNKSFIPTE